MYFCFCVTGLPQTAMAIIADVFFLQYIIYYYIYNIQLNVMSQRQELKNITHCCHKCASVLLFILQRKIVCSFYSVQSLFSLK